MRLSVRWHAPWEKWKKRWPENWIKAGAVLDLRSWDPGLRLDPFSRLLVVFAASLGDSSIACLAIGDWIRWSLTKELPHSSNSSMIEIEPKYQGWLNAPGVFAVALTVTGACGQTGTTSRDIMVYPACPPGGGDAAGRHAYAVASQ